jgi:hypothetical protein
MSTLKLTEDILQAAIVGLEVQKLAVDAKIAELRQLLDGGAKQSDALSETVKPRKKRSAAVRRKMALAQRARWQKLKQSSEPAEDETAKPKRRMSAEGRRNIIAATKKRWALKRAASEAAQAKKPGRKNSSKQAASKASKKAATRKSTAAKASEPAAAQSAG